MISEVLDEPRRPRSHIATHTGFVSILHGFIFSTEQSVKKSPRPVTRHLSRTSRRSFSTEQELSKSDRACIPKLLLHQIDLYPTSQHLLATNHTPTTSRSTRTWRQNTVVACHSSLHLDPSHRASTPINSHRNEI